MLPPSGYVTVQSSPNVLVFVADAVGGVGPGLPTTGADLSFVPLGGVPGDRVAPYRLLPAAPVPVDTYVYLVNHGPSNEQVDVRFHGPGGAVKYRVPTVLAPSQMVFVAASGSLVPTEPPA